VREEMMKPARSVNIFVCPRCKREFAWLLDEWPDGQQCLDCDELDEQEKKQCRKLEDTEAAWWAEHRGLRGAVLYAVRVDRAGELTSITLKGTDGRYWRSWISTWDDDAGLDFDVVSRL